MMAPCCDDAGMTGNAAEWFALFDRQIATHNTIHIMDHNSAPNFVAYVGVFIVSAYPKIISIITYD